MAAYKRSREFTLSATTSRLSLTPISLRTGRSPMVGRSMPSTGKAPSCRRACQARRACGAQFLPQGYYRQTFSRRLGDPVITRRNFLLAGSVGLLVANRPSLGQTRPKIPHIGVLWFGSTDTLSASQNRSVFRQRLAALGYVEGKNI